ncbi:hypothetical protein TNCV_4396631 [Trichonephila clavipes]|uniref:Uncharacterized protein n=1 Tax=Trichonephila clavipes TaxID=2585209 RepID=A0A8X6W5Y2_TRICX|nr:hypothetical protein TNCV_4396631 [Trichonephila clavipes]
MKRVELDTGFGRFGINFDIVVMTQWNGSHQTVEINSIQRWTEALQSSLFFSQGSKDGLITQMRSTSFKREKLKGAKHETGKGGNSNRHRPSVKQANFKYQMGKRGGEMGQA